MLFLNPWLLLGLAGAGIPVVIHLVRKQAAKPVEWGAMRFLFDTISVRRRKMEWEDLLLMAARCLLLALLAVALARPFIPPDSPFPWLFVLPAGLLGIALFGASFVLGNAKVRWIVRGIGIALLVGAVGLGFVEKFLNLKRYEPGGRRDVALVIDASASMEITHDRRTVFQQAIEDARQIVRKSPDGTAFTVILGGPAPEVRTAAPLAHRADVLGVLDKLEPIGGNFRAYEALGQATAGLAKGGNAAKQIIVFTDSQRSGWRFDDAVAWDGLDTAWKALPSKPKLLLWDLGVPAAFRNLALDSIELSRSAIGTDRELLIRLAIENTGSAAITSGPVTMEIDGKSIGAIPVGLLVPGQKETVEFRHQFTRSGPQVVSARLDSNDDMAADNRIERAVMVRESLPVLLVDGNPAGSFFERAAGYTALALTPTTGMIRPKAAPEKFLMAPRIVQAKELRAEDLDGASVVVLADVARLPGPIADKLATQVAAGKGLLVIAGPAADARFYNRWKGIDGPLLPVSLGEESAGIDGISPAASTFTHESLRLFAKNADLESANIKRWRKTGESVAGGIQAAAFSNGDTFLSTRSYGSGRCLLATCAFDSRSGNLPARKSFVPLIHELVTWAAGGGVDLNTDSAWSPRFTLDAAKDSGSPAPATMNTLDPRGLPRTASAAASRQGRVLTIDGPAVPGVYQVSAGTTFDALIPGIRDGILSVVVSRDADESRFENMTPDDLALVRKHTDLLQPHSVADVLGALQGKGFGREIWKTLAVAAFVLFMLESILARWVTRSRRTTEDVRIEFGETTVWRAGK